MTLRMLEGNQDKNQLDKIRPTKLSQTTTRGSTKPVVEERGARAPNVQASILLEEKSKVEKVKPPPGVRPIKSILNISTSIQKIR